LKIAAIMGSPRRGGNTEILLDAFLSGAVEGEAEVDKISVGELEIAPCAECLDCETTGECVIRDGMDEIYRRLLEADRIVIASPIFFYGLPAQLKALIDRGQALWYRKREERETAKKGFALLLGATRGKNLFQGSLLTIRYFLKTIPVRLTGSLVYREIEEKGEILSHPTALAEAGQAGRAFAASGGPSTSTGTSTI
jgi:multimeric flavodoxin WrbA